MITFIKTIFKRLMGDVLYVKLRNVYWKFLRRRENKKKNARVHKKFLKSLFLKRKPHGCDTRITVSITTFPARINKVHLAIETILAQSVKPDRIVLFLGDDCKEIKLPLKLLFLKMFGVKIIRVSGNIKSHKKYYYALKQYPEDILVTIDDDLLYEEDMLEKLISSYRKFPNCISAWRVHRIVVSENKVIKSYVDWDFECTKLIEPSFELFFTSGAGTLFPPKCLDNRVFDMKAIKSLCLDADDVWLNMMARLKGTRIVFVPNERVLPEIINETQSVTLYEINMRKENGQCPNDVYIDNISKAYGITLTGGVW